MNKKSKKLISKILVARKLENIKLIEEIEEYLLVNRGYVFKAPTPNEPVILIVSGGLDSVLVWSYLLIKYKACVYPLFLRRGQRRVAFEEKAVDFFSTYFQKKYPGFSKDVVKLDASIPPLSIRFPITIASDDLVGKNGQKRGIPMYSNLLFSYAVQYGYFLEIEKKKKVRKILAGFMPDDGLVMKDETLTATRLFMKAAIELTGDESWQISSLPLEKELGFFHKKWEWIKWGAEQKIPLEKTRSCIIWGETQCGNCLSCILRKNSFKKAKVKDKTVYKDPELSFKNNIRKIFLRKIKSIFIKLRFI